MIKRSLNMNLKKFQNLKVAKSLFDRLLALVSSNLDERVKSYGYLKNQGHAVLWKKKSYG